MSITTLLTDYLADTSTEGRKKLAQLRAAITEALNDEQDFAPDYPEWGPVRLIMRDDTVGGGLHGNLNKGIIDLSKRMAYIKQQNEIISEQATAGFILISSFEDGATLTLSNEVLLFEQDGQYYRWTGELPKIVDANSTPDTTGGIGGGKWVLVGDSALRSQLRQADGAEMVGTNQGLSLQNLLNNYQLSLNRVTPQMFGAKADGINDDTSAIQAAIDYVNPFVWQGSVNNTDRYRPVEGYVYLPAGQYRITSPLRLPPFIRIEGVCKMSWEFYGGSVIFVDFADIKAYALDTANYDSTGTINWGVDTYSKEASDQRLNSRATAIYLKNFGIYIPNKNAIKGGLNLCLAHDGTFEGLMIRGAACAVNLSCSWNGSFRDCTFVGYSAAVTLRKDITTYIFDNCYFTSSGTGNPNDWFDYPDTTRPTINNKTAGIVGIWSSPHLINCTIENSQHGIRLARGVKGGACTDIYFEGISEYLFALFEVNMTMRPSYTHTWDADLNTCKFAWLDGSPSNRYIIDLGNTEYFSKDISPIDIIQYTQCYVINNNNFLGNYYVPARKLTYATYSKEAGYCDIYLSAQGNDNNLGYKNFTCAVATLQEAIFRCVPHLKNRIYIQGGNEIATKRTYQDSTNVTNKIFDGYHIEVIGDTANKPTIQISSNDYELFGIGLSNSQLRMSSVNIVLNSNTSNSNKSYHAFLYASGSVSALFNNCLIQSADVSSIGFIVSPAYSNAGIVNINLENCTLSDVKIIESSYANNSNLQWTLNHAGCTFNNASFGNEALKISAKNLN